VLHRDIKPENVLLARPGSIDQVLLSDFGLVKVLEDVFWGPDHDHGLDHGNANNGTNHGRASGGAGGGGGGAPAAAGSGANARAAALGTLPLARRSPR